MIKLVKNKLGKFLMINLPWMNSKKGVGIGNFDKLEKVN